jgi:predicted AAA+ superfamily ATPase
MVNKISRHIKSQLEKWFYKGKALLLIGPRQVGKTTLLKLIAKEKSEEAIWLDADLPEIRQQLENPTLAIIKATIGSYKLVILDEIQRLPNAGLLLKIMVDNFEDVQFIATGSSSLEISETIFEPLTGRHILFNLYPFGISELYPKKSPFQIEQTLAFHLVYGMYPEITQKQDIAETLLQNLAEQYLYKDVLIWKDIRKPELLDKLLKLLAYQVGSEVNNHELSKALRVQSETVESYIDLLEKSFVVYRLNSYSTNERKEVSKMSKVYFWDNGIRNAVIGNYNALANRNDHGQLWENFITSERLKTLRWTNSRAKSYFWRNYNQSEVDYVELDNEQLTAYEMKWNTTKNHKVTRAFTNMYPNAKTEIITPKSFVGFVLSV